MNMKTAVPAACLLLAAAAFADMPTIDWELTDAIRQIDSQAEDFESAMARVEFAVTDSDGNVVRSHSGNGFIRKDGDMRYSQDGGNRIMIVDGNTINDYDKAAATVTVYSASKDKSRLEPYYRLGFSISGRDMQDRYLVTILGEEEMGDTRTLVLELTPERDSERAVVGKIRLWIDQASWMPRKQEFSSRGDGSTTTLTYTDMARNLRLNPDLFKDDWPRGTKRVRN
ncbi:MAG: outer membrane lipoprotein-sorting protein [Gammaproteobacteria bacterium]|nr:outer membrane lipoprotein-sorting protein [Gammaproteobacteria bacterium]MDH5345961.1 outer membrane lipoprotein-sorting protein [Gammaproteobacteria bacterium]